MITKNHQAQALRCPFMDLDKNLAMISNILEVTTGILYPRFQVERSRKLLSNLVMREDEVGEMGEVEVEKRGENFSPDEH